MNGKSDFGLVIMIAYYAIEAFVEIDELCSVGYVEVFSKIYF